MRILPWILFAVTALGLVGYIGYNYGGRSLGKQAASTERVMAPTAMPTQTSGGVVVAPTMVPTAAATSKTYQGNKFAFTYPLDMELKTQGETTTLTKWGPTQKEGTEFYDGISLSFKSGQLNGQTVKQHADQRAAELGGVFETSPVTAVTLGQFSGYKFHVKGYAEVDYYYMDLGTNMYLEIVDGTKDAGNMGFATQVAQILATLTP